MALILDHINGVADDNRLENLQIVCPNCAATLDTHCGARTGDARSGACERCGDDVPQPTTARQRYCSQRLRAALAGRAGRRSRARRRVERPPYEQLRGGGGGGRAGARSGGRYGVSDNAVRKWVRGV